MGLGAQYASSLRANRDWFEGLPEHVQTALTQAADAAEQWYLSDLSAAVDATFATMADGGATVSDAPDEMRQTRVDGMDDAARTWAEQLDGSGYEASTMLADYMKKMRASGATPLRNWDGN